ncbi:SDR family oxidoreductase [Marinomonas mediterranea]|jgi:Dehydrogenases with different specificities (related to short-chain alcohol dehydrogenases)|uniref:3-oxoacyl-(Acyl-carrier-protein) reductase n=1 Tax=Marinomonas mediterranea (strain ATCC 700492 / JCM 21426 / NBRC 103028 / MMB-1) TaxID=717774 RepID=F2K4B6_MARM1|nr:SDR family oxidoreductase [Marinomonas mediterranea]ADZ92557.1 3-oxoacyl-(acyl-carrier-protein) reductase [Marinomonas mediterranea MMB-1]WCN10501.1 SDR family oxidoreductase [Marinomonas mediterranea]WCN14551.1 SDR family oxidoreductase [Marinomonas mediterranea]WCN18601.1 SDR family oxidoreductase [Marinomonas mediterranea MMB-1]
MSVVKTLFSLQGKNILITGGSGHIAKTVARAFYSCGANLILIDQNEDALREAKDDLLKAGTDEQHIYISRVDLENGSEVSRFLQEINDGYSTLDVLINAAAFVGSRDLDGWAVPFLEQSVDTWRRCLEVNLTAPFTLIQGVFHLMNNAKSPSIINVSSIYGQVGPDMSLYHGTDMGNPAAYGASKAGLAQLTRWLCTSLPSKFRVNTITPGGVERGQDIHFKARYCEKTTTGRMAKEEDLVGTFMLLASDAGSYITGQDIAIDGGWTAK